jgi:poly(hydroxyalkanoate) depolymerase family esterase
MEATRVIQQALGRGEARQHGAPVTEREPELEPTDDAIDVPFREVAPATARIDTGVRPVQAPRVASFTAHFFAHGGHRWRYRLYEPERSDPAALLPVVVMLHGCKQDSEDFARGTGMNEVAARDGFLVLYPEQLRKSNQMGCWNWFEPRHQQRDGGEPAMIVALVQAMVAQHGGDPQRVYVAGLSAGGAMAATLGDLYPEVFAAVGIHSGLPPRAAHDVQSAFSAMRRGTAAAASAPGAVLPTVVFHGSGDRTVAPANGEAVVQRQVAAAAANGLLLERREENVTGTRSAKRIAWVDDSGRRVIESWQVRAGPHAWSGGDAAGSFTDPQGPNASEAMAAFFLRHRRAG